MRLPPLAGIGSETLGRARSVQYAIAAGICAKNEPCRLNSSGRPFSVCRIRAPGDSIAADRMRAARALGARLRATSCCHRACRAAPATHCGRLAP